MNSTEYIIRIYREDIHYLKGPFIITEYTTGKYKTDLLESLDLILEDSRVKSIDIRKEQVND